MSARHLRRQLEQHPRVAAGTVTLLLLLSQAVSTVAAGGGDPINGP